jgi:hypothetical protein
MIVLQTGDEIEDNRNHLHCTIFIAGAIWGLGESLDKE